MSVLLRKAYVLIVVALVWGARWLPLQALREWLIDTIASVAHLLSRAKKRQTTLHLRRTLGRELGEDRIAAITRSVFRRFWENVFALNPSRAEVSALQQAQMVGTQHLQAALDGGRGVILWESKAFGARNMAKQILCRNGFQVHQVHAQTHMGGFSALRLPVGRVRSWSTRFFAACERRFVEGFILVPKSDSLAFTRALLARLRENAAVCSASDGGLGQKFVSLPFLSGTRRFATGMVSLARISGAPILPIFCIADKSGPARLFVEKPIRLEAGRDRDASEQAIREYATLLDSYIRRYPEHYFYWEVLERSRKR